MQILVNEGHYAILNLPTDVIQTIAKVARTCYQSFKHDEPEKNKKLVQALLRRNHEAMIEFADMTVKFYDVSRGFTHEMVRHRLCSFAQESTRYVDESELKIVAPPHQDPDTPIIPVKLMLLRSASGTITTRIAAAYDLEAIKREEDGHDYIWMEEKYEVLGCIVHELTLVGYGLMLEQGYRGLRQAGWPPEDARQILPIGMANDIVVKANLREWRHIFAMRTAKAAHWEIRRIMCNLLAECQLSIPYIFDDFKRHELENGEVYYTQESFDFAEDS